VVTRPFIAFVFATLVAACSGSGSAATPAASAPVAGSSAPSAAASGGAPSGEPITNHGPKEWNRGPYQLAGGTYRLDWETDGSCTALYFGIVGETNGYRENPPTAGDVALKDMLKGSRTITGVPAGSYFFNVSNVACKSYSATLTPVS
jgi:hypothetical protein